jgi:hypothetical protein
VGKRHFMDCRKLFNRFTDDLLDLIQKYTRELELAESGEINVDEIIARLEVESCKLTEPVFYAQNIKKSANRKK